MTITGKDLIISFKNKVVRNVIITQTNKGKYQLTVELTWRKEKLTLITARKTIREWVSLDSLVKHIHQHYGIPPQITLILFEPEEIKQ